MKQSAYYTSDLSFCFVLQYQWIPVAEMNIAIPVFGLGSSLLPNNECDSGYLLILIIACGVKDFSKRFEACCEINKPLTKEMSTIFRKNGFSPSKIDFAELPNDNVECKKTLRRLC